MISGFQRQMMPCPQNLSAGDVEAWRNMESRGAPWAIGDGIVWAPGDTRVELASTSWSSLYATALIVVRSIQGTPIADYTKTALFRASPSTGLEEEFHRRTASWIQRYLLFLAEWDIAKYLGTWETRQPSDMTCLPPDAEAKLLGLNAFATREKIAKYVLLWQNNPSVVANGIASHRLVSARGLDLVCSELLANAFEHGGAPQLAFTSDFLQRHMPFVTNVISSHSPAHSRLRILVEEIVPKGLVDEVKCGTHSALEQFSNALNQLMAKADLLKDEWLGFAARRSQEIAACQSNTSDKVLLNRLVLEECFPAECPLPRPLVLAKLCMHTSAEVALKLHAQRPYLEPHEQYMYAKSVTDKHSILQLVIADFGSGLTRNSALIARHKADAASLPPEDRHSLIGYALRPEVTTKLHTPAIRHEWGSYLRPGVDVKDYTATVHGLSEVRNVIEEASGFWRIHTGNTVADICKDCETATHPAGGYTERCTELAVDGCLHYIALPLLSKKRVHTKRSKSGKANLTAFIHFEAPLDSETNDAPPGSIDWQVGVRRVVSELLTVSPRTDVAVIALGNLDAVDDTDVGEVCAVLIDAIHRVRNRTAVILAGAGDRLCSHLQRFEAWQKVFLDRYIVACVNDNAGELESRIFCGAEVMPIRDVLADALVGRARSVTSNEETQDLILDVVAHNRGLFEIHDGLVTSTVHIDVKDPRWLRSINGGWEFNRLAAEIIRHRAVDCISGLSRLGEPIQFYIHLGRLWSDEMFRSRIRSWLSQTLLAILHSRSALKAQSTAPRYCILSLLQPATDMVRLVRVYDPTLKELEFVDLRRMDMLRWDCQPLASLASMQVICVTDITRSRATLHKLNRALSAHGASLVAVCSVLLLRSEAGETAAGDEYGFVEATPSAFSQWGSALPTKTQSKASIVDADTQSISQIKKLSLATWKAKSQALIAMLARGDLVVAHGVFGDRHHTLYSRLSRASEDFRFDVVDDILLNCHKFFDKAPDVVLYPSDSTIVYLLRERQRIGGERYIPLSSQRLGHGAQRLMLEGDGQLSGLDTNTGLNILFLDDSRSSGDTERAAIRAYLTQRNEVLKRHVGAGPTDTWLSYVILYRHGVDDPGKDSAARTIRDGAISLKFVPRHYVQCGVLAMDRRSCPFEEAATALRHALGWLKYARPSLRESLNNTYRWARGASIEETEDCPSLSPNAATWFAFMSDHDMPSGLLSATEDTSDKDQLAAACLFISVHCSEAAAYLSEEQLCAPYMRAAGIITHDGEELAAVLSVAVALLPASVTSAFVTPLALKLWRRNLGETAGCILAAFFGRFDKAVQIACDRDAEVDTRFIDKAAQNQRLASMTRLRQEHWRSLWCALQSEGVSSSVSGTTAVARCDLLVLRDGAAEHDAITTARQLGALGVAARLDHMSFLRCRLAQGKVEEVHPLVKTAGRCATSLLRLLGLDAPQNQKAKEHELEDLADKVDRCSSETEKQGIANDYRKAAIAYCEYIHQEGPLNRHFTMGKILANMVFTSVSDFRSTLIQSSRNLSIIDLMIASEDVPQEVCRQMLLLPDATSMQDILANLVRNPFDHLFEDKLFTESNKEYQRVVDHLVTRSSLPFVRTHIRFDRNANSVSLVVMDKGSQARSPHLFNPRHGLGNARVLLELYGGTLRHIALANEHTAKCEVLDAVQRTVGLSEYKSFVNAFIIELPVVWEVSEPWPA